MFKHYLKIALSNLKKYALQNTISILGLAAGFVCLSLSSIWLYFENSFDTFHKDADRIFAFSRFMHDGREIYNESYTYYTMPTIMEFPEIESYTQYGFVKHEDQDATEIKVDSSFFSNFFEVKIISGDNIFLKDSSYIAITPAFAKKMFPGEDPIGKSCFGKTVCAVIKDFGINSIIQFDALSTYPFRLATYYNSGSYDGPGFDLFTKLFIKVKEGIDITSFAEMANTKLSSIPPYIQTRLTPIKEVHRLVAKKDMYVNYVHMKIVFVASILLMICAIFNYMLFSLNRLKKRQREMALRLVNGSTEKSLVLLLTTEVAIVIGTAMILGLLLVQIIQPYFIKLADVQMTKGFVTSGSIIVMIIAFLLSLSLCSLAVRTTRRNTMQNSISRSNNDNFRKVSISIQTFISVLFIFAVSVMIHQLNYLRNNDWGTKINDIVVLSIPNPTDPNYYYISNQYVYYPPENEEEEEKGPITIIKEDPNIFYKRIDNQFGLTEKFRSIPAVNSIHFGIGDINSIIEGAQSLASNSTDPDYRRFTLINGRDSMKVKVLDIADQDKLALLGVTVIDGEIPNRPLQKDEIIVTEDFQKEFGLGGIDEEPTVTIERSYRMPVRGYFDENNNFIKVSGGETGLTYYTFRVVAIIKDIYAYKFDAPSSHYMIIICSPNNRRLMPASNSGWKKSMVTLEYKHGMKKEVKEQISKIIDETGLDYRMEFTEDAFFSSLESQEHLKNLILTLGFICVFVAVFGIWSMITLTCQERRREIAVRKVHGAKVRDILQIFAREYGALLTLASALAFGVGFIIMHHWQQQYERQAVISWWIYAGIFVSTAIIICLTVLQRVLKTARENPADVIKSE